MIMSFYPQIHQVFQFHISQYSLIQKISLVYIFSPVHKMKLVEVIRTKETSLQTISKVFDFITQIKKSYFS